MTHPFRAMTLSFILLMAAYSIFSWALYSIMSPAYVWAIALGIAIVQAVLLTTLSEGLRQFIDQWLRSDIGYFSVVIVIAFSLTLMLVWYQVFEYVFILIGAEILLRLDLQNAGFNRWQSLLVLMAGASVGLGLGWGIHYTFEQARFFMG
ncbi:MAG: hypothetical protein AAFY26_00255 [Cyanobacteria bacterium J06638_22]